MPDPTDLKLGELLQYGESPEPDAFVLDVMRGVRREQRIRRLILWIFGLAGALFGVAGALMLSDRITWLFTQTLSATGIMQGVLVIVAVVCFYTWFMNDDLSLPG